MPALAEPPIVTAIEARLRALLDLARTVKTETTVEPILSTAELDHDIKHLADWDQPLSKDTRHVAVETAARSILYRLIASTSFNDPDFVQVWNLLDIVQAAADHNQAHVVLFMLLIEEMLDTQTLEGCRRVFDYLESRREKIVASVFAKNKLILLRTCNELLRRLSKAEDAVFAGRIYIFLFQSYPLGDKSSVNLRGEFHTENVTTYEDLAAELAGSGGQGGDDSVMDVDKNEDGAASAADKSRATPGITTTDTQGKTLVTKEERVDDMEPTALYPIFWSLQSAFCNPPSLFDDKALAEFQNGLELTAKKFKTIRQPTPKSMSARSGSAKDASAFSRKRKSMDAAEDGDMYTPERAPPNNLFEAFNPKYLTTASLFELELADLTFHRHICVQALILLDFLLSLTPKAKAHMAQFKPQRAVAYAYTLSPENEAWANGMRRQIESYLLRHPDGASYSRMVEHVLSRDKGWVRWKAQNCPPIERPPVATESVIEAQRNAKARTTWKRIKTQPMGAMDWSFLSDAETNPKALMARCKTVAEMEALKPDPDVLIREVQSLDLEIEMELPRGEELAKRNEELDAKEKEAKRPLREEREKLRADRQDYLRTKADLESQRASRTWLLMRETARTNFGLLKEIDERKDVTLCSPAKQAERAAKEKEEAAKKSAEQAAADEAHASNDVPVGAGGDAAEGDTAGGEDTAGGDDAAEDTAGGEDAAGGDDTADKATGGDGGEATETAPAGPEITADTAAAAETGDQEA